ncbi:TetR/AcrR family transcriptional regulator [Glycomyces buryatensis]|uniref:TetR family transcriptional regulator n=1 Tax=Glycomyces buryatensis TaxID=2570927 RepID=A0A4S8PQR4_9ACTN|nr:TetR/AcrR family transcriptional regulator [Glycomyces buryatensis]THV33510.1 TetR family transcriptional regulator [Glycomyces buryatensis]
MPRTADHDVRRTQIAGAVHRLIAHAGLDAATMAAVAREADMSVGLVQHYFRSKDDLLLFAYRRTTGDMLERVEHHVAEGEAAQRTIAAILLTSLQELWPLDERRRGEYRIGRAFHARSLDNPTVATVARETAAALRAQIATAVSNGKHCGEVELGTDAEEAAVRLSALVDGMADQLYLDPERPVGNRGLTEVAADILQGALADVFSGECHRHDPDWVDPVGRRTD